VPPEGTGKALIAIPNTRQILGFRFLVSLLIFVTFDLAVADPGFKISPYVQRVDMTSATVLWNPVGGKTGQVRYGTTTAYGSSAEGHIEYTMTNERPRPEKASVVRARLVALLPDTIYHYRVVHSSFESADRAFRTAPADANSAFKFLVYGDNRDDPRTHARVIHAAALLDPPFVLHTGDMVPSSIDGEKVWREQFFEPAERLLRKTWFSVTRGNHERDSPLFSLYFGALGGTQINDYCSFDWGRVHVATINTNRDYQPGSEQYQFLEQDLATTSRPFKVFFGHHPFYSSGPHGSERALQEYLQPILEKCGVKLVFAGHDHDYERTIVNGITYVVSGGAGAPLYDQRILLITPSRLIFRKAYNFVRTDVTSEAMTLTAWIVDNKGVAILADRAVIAP
jgi:hypothetical protein